MLGDAGALHKCKVKPLMTPPNGCIQLWLGSSRNLSEGLT